VVWAVVAVFAALFVAGCSAGSASDFEQVGSVGAALCSGLKISATAEQADPSKVDVAATGASCDVGETPVYAYYYLPPSGGYVLFQNFTASPTAVWNTAGLPSGAYQVVVVVRAASGGGQSSAYLDKSYYVGTTCSSTTAFNFSPAAPQPSGTQVTLSATATCTGSGTPTFQYLYAVAGSSSYSYVNNDSSFHAGPVAWNTAGLSGNYTLIVFARAAGNTGGGESYLYGSYTFGTASTVCKTVSISASPASPQPIGATLTLTATSSPCSNPEYQFYYRVYGPSAFTPIGTWGSASRQWNTTGLTQSGTYEILVAVRNIGNTGGADVYSEIAYALGSTCSSTSVNASPPSPQGVGTSITLTGSATCSNSAAAEYRFQFLKTGDAAASQIGTGYSTSPVVWDTSALTAGTYQLTIFARAVGSGSDYDTFAQVGYTLSPKTVVQMATGTGYHSCAVLNNGTAHCWGNNASGQLGNGTTASSTAGVAVSGLTTVSAVATGEDHSCAVLSDHTVRCWGSNQFGQLGNGTTTSSTTPVTATGISDATAVTCGQNHTCVLRSGGAVSCWGNNPHGEVGDATPTNFPQATSPVTVSGISGATVLSAGGFNTCAVVGGAAKCWGEGTYGALGNGSTTNSFVPVSVTGLTSGVTSIASGIEYGCAVVSGSVSCWGDNTYGQLGNGTKTASTTPVSVQGLSGASQVAANFVSSCALLSGGSVSCWGYNNEGELGNGGSAESLSPSAVSGVNTATLLSVGSVQSCVTLSSGAAQCWGYNAFGQLGNGNTADAHTPVTVSVN